MKRSGGSQRGWSMDHIRIELINTVCRDLKNGDKEYTRSVHISLRQLPFETRQVLLRFARGPELDFSLFDMDRLAVEYLRLRGVTLPQDGRELTSVRPPPLGDFLISRSFLHQAITE